MCINSEKIHKDNVVKWKSKLTCIFRREKMNSHGIIKCIQFITIVKIYGVNQL